ncbi:helix-turn-helix transcriptional regulator [Bacteriovorax sp. Seq25_V]|uniref:helix-turn-helix domain-containing protein n=1 Tax=Bacteriovorax sp. Seq25_V TaxID=1201288 RepID=UPI00038A0980|nr:helix-turn-helix transcriptional regulator [Bacteriovorax sp. Seq25_V]EQC46902.1 DNA-binding helix-turn-helix protein [Bacteriovorax sp. Seq25_V]
MSEFNRDKFDDFLGIVRKYMQVRGPMSQKDLAEKTRIGVSTLSRFMSMKTADINPQIVAKVVAILDIPLHEMIDFVEEHYTERFVRLLKFYQADKENDYGLKDAEEQEEEKQAGGGTPEEFVERRQQPPPAGPQNDSFEDAVVDVLSSGTAQRNANAKVQIGSKTRTIPFAPDQAARNSEMSVRERLQALTPRQKAYVSDFLSLDIEARDLIVDLGNDLFRYFRQKGMIH